MRLAIVGSMGFNNYEMMCAVVDELRKVYKIYTIVSGGAKGADRLAERYANEHNIKLVVFPAEWTKYGNGAGFIRNKTIWDNADFGVAFWDGQSKGTAHSFKISEKQNKLLYVFEYNTMKFYLHDKLKIKINNIPIF